MENSFLRLRVYNTDGHGVMMSLFDEASFKVLESRYSENSLNNLNDEMTLAGCSTIDSLTISNWDDFYCLGTELKPLLDQTQPTEIDIPAYLPETDNGKVCKKIINVFCNDSLFASKFEAGPKTLINPTELEDKEYSDIILGPRQKYQDAKNNSVVKLYWTGRFTILNTSLCMVADCAKDLEELLEGKPLDVLILSSTDGDNEFLENSFLERFAPACILIAGKKNSLYLKKDGSAEKRGIHTLHLESGDIVLYSGFHKKNSNVSQGDDTVGADGQYAITELSS